MSLPAALISISFSDVSGTLRAHTRISTLPSTSCSYRFLFASLVNDLLVHQFGQIHHRHLAFHARHLDRIFYIRHAEWTCRHDYAGPCVPCPPTSASAPPSFFLPIAAK